MNPRLTILVFLQQTYRKFRNSCLRDLWAKLVKKVMLFGNAYQFRNFSVASDKPSFLFTSTLNAALNFMYSSGFPLNFCTFGFTIFTKAGSIFSNNWCVFDVCTLGSPVAEVFTSASPLAIEDSHVSFLRGSLETSVTTSGLVDLIPSTWGFQRQCFQ